jgi:peptidoglycan/LPS O-acetylase OafA/YrhL
VSAAANAGHGPAVEPSAQDARGHKAKETSLSHITALDGLRGIAVLLVLLFHFAWTFPDTDGLAHLVRRVLWTGWTGVDLFFVLSGYLITRGLVARSTRPTKERMRLFWTRRFLRIFPLYYAYILVGTVVVLAVGGFVPGLSYWLYVQNYALAFDPEPLHWTSHLWSLAIEEQFYFVWPLFALLAPRRMRVPFTLLAVAGCVGARAALALLAARASDPEHALTLVKLAYRATPTHMDGLLLGALMAMFAVDGEHPLARLWPKIRPAVTALAALAVAGLVVVTHGFETYDRRIVIAGYFIIAVMFVGFVSLAVDNRLHPRALGVLTSAPLRACGRVSYGMYILHWPMVVVSQPWLEAKHADLASKGATGQSLLLALGVIALGIVVTYLAAEVSFRVLESPFLRLKERFHG